MAVVCGVEGGICASIAGDVVESGSSWAGDAVATNGVAGLATGTGLTGSGSIRESVGTTGGAGSVEKSISGVAGDTSSGGRIASEAIPSAVGAEIGASNRECTSCTSSAGTSNTVEPEGWQAGGTGSGGVADGATDGGAECACSIPVGEGATIACITVGSDGLIARVTGSTVASAGEAVDAVGAGIAGCSIVDCGECVGGAGLAGVVLGCVYELSGGTLLEAAGD